MSEGYFKQYGGGEEKGLRPAINNNLPKVYIETYGCQMNFNDTEVVVSLLEKAGFAYTEEISEARLLLLNTCSIRDNAEQRVWGRLDQFKQYKKKDPSIIIGIIGCMAERLKEELVEKEQVVDLVIGPDAYRDIALLVEKAESGQKGINVLLSREETYAEISPVRLDKNGVSAFISIMRGCNNMCSYCVVPYTRGAERSRDPESIIQEAETLVKNQYKEITLLGQNVNSYSGFDKKSGKQINFAQLLEKVAQISPNLRVRFSTSHPKDMSDELLYTMAMYENICNHIHLPAQSGSSRILELMNRKYDRNWYLQRIAAIKEILPACSISTDIISGFCTETEEDHQETLSLMKEVGYDFAFMFKYSERQKTKEAQKLKKDVSEEIKTRMLTEIINLQGELSSKSKETDLGNTYEVLIEGVSRKSISDFFGRTSQNKVVVFPREDKEIGDYVFVKILDYTSATLLGRIAKK